MKRSHGKWQQSLGRLWWTPSMVMSCFLSIVGLWGQPSRLNICWYFGWVWKILNLSDDETSKCYRKSGEAKGAIDRCKKFLNNVETRSHSLFCQKPSFPMIFSSSVNLPAKSSSTPGKTLRYALLFVSHNKVVLCLLLFEPKHPCPSIESISECFKSLSTAPELLWLPAHLSEPTHPALVPISTWWIPPCLPLFPHPLLQLVAVAPSSCLLQILLLCELLPRPNHPSFSWLSLPSSPPVPFSPFSSSHQPWRCWFLPLNLWPDPFRFGFICWLFWTSNGQLAH